MRNCDLGVRFLFIGLAVLIGGLPMACGANKNGPNVIFILADDLGYGDLGCYGQEKIKTPHLDQMASEGMRFTQFYAGSTVCAPSRCVLMTGKHVGHATIRGNKRVPLNDNDVTVAQVLKNSGYATGLVGKWGLGEIEDGSDPLERGFDHFFGYLNQGHAHNYYPSHLYRNQERVSLNNIVPEEKDSGAGVATKQVEYSHDLFAQDALAFVEEHHEQPFFLYLALTIPHANNEAKNKGMEVPDLGDYADRDWPAAQKGHAAMITRMDADLGRLFAQLRELGIDEETIVFFSSDNGPHREGGNDPDFANSNGPLRGIKRDLYEGGIRVPMIVRWPGHIESGSTSDFMGSFADVLPTVAELTRSEAPGNLDGISFLPELTGNDQPAHDVLYWEFYEGRGGAQAVRQGDWKAVRKPAFDGPIELYNLGEDISEQNDLAKQHPERVGQMKEIMEREHTPSDVWTVRSR